MKLSLTRRALVVLATLALLVVSTATLAHSHADVTSVEQSHCALCLVAHTATHAAVASIVTVQFTPVRTALSIHPKSLGPAYVQPSPNQDRGPPQI
jgi:hypothetical protein